jgi:hypothetical protein
MTSMEIIFCIQAPGVILNAGQKEYIFDTMELAMTHICSFES